MKTYKALDHTGKSICTVFGKTEKEARQNAEKQLLRPGRKEYLNSWNRGGKQLEEVMD